ncbi:transketolase [Candidatus Woesearchaeota archaeon]|nr:transketolase [Candidatus Woesearchaeota archaeon]
MLSKKEQLKLKKKANLIRQDIIRMIYHAESGHPAGSLSMTDILTYLYFKFLKTYPDEPNSPKRDYLILSNGHICPALYATLAHKGFFKTKELLTLRKLDSQLQGHPHRTELPGLETSSGPLGSGLSQGAGIALALKHDNKNNKVIVLTSDGEHDEGNTWEAAMLTAKYKLDNLIQIMDKNHIQIDGFTDEIMPLGNIKKNYESFGWHVQEINGHNFQEIEKALNKATHFKGKPSLIIANTIPGKGVTFMQNTNKWHGKAPDHHETHEAILQLKGEYEKLK